VVVPDVPSTALSPAVLMMVGSVVEGAVVVVVGVEVDVVEGGAVIGLVTRREGRRRRRCCALASAATAAPKSIATSNRIIRLLNRTRIKTNLLSEPVHA
jgi:hypothetical protein